MRSHSSCLSLPAAAPRALLPGERGARARSGWPRCQHSAAAASTGAKVGTSRGWMRRGSPGSSRRLPWGHGPPHTYTHIYTHRYMHTAPVTLPPHAHRPHAPPASKQTLRCPHSTDSAHTQPQAGGRRYSPRSLRAPSSGALTHPHAAELPGAAHLGWAEKGREPAARRRPRRRSTRVAILRDRAGHDRAPRVIPAPAYLRLAVSSGLEAGACCNVAIINIVVV